MLHQWNVVIVLLFVLGACADAAEVPLHTVSGLVDKADKESITIRPRGASGRFEKDMVLRLVGTSKVTLLVPQMKGGKVVYTRREVAAKDLEAKQPIVAIYAKAKGGGFVLLTAVVQKAP
jgi:hypothetical protein